MFIVPSIWLLLFFTHRYRIIVVDSSNVKEVEAAHAARAAQREAIKQIPYRKTKLLLCGVASGIYSSIESGWFNFSITMFQYLPITLDAKTAAHLMSILAASYTVGRLVTAFILFFVVPDIILAYHYAIIVSSLTVLAFFRDNYTVIVIASAILGKFSLY